MNNNSNLLLSAFALLVLIVASTFVTKEINTESLVDDGVWSWFGENRALQIDNNVYFSYVTSDGDLEVASSSTKSPKEVSRFTLNKSFETDDHSHASLLHYKDDTLVAFYSKHGGDKIYYRQTAVPKSINKWKEEKSIDFDIVGKHGVTYPNPVMLKGENNRVYLFFRGDDWKSYVTHSDNLEDWSDALPIFHVYEHRPYMKVSHTDSEIHFAVTDGHPKSITNNVYHFYYENGEFYNSEGNFLKRLNSVPLTPEQVTQVHGTLDKNENAWVWDIAKVGDDIAIVYTTFDQSGRHFYRYARYLNGEWESKLVEEAGPHIGGNTEAFYSPGITLSHTDINVIYTSTFHEYRQEIHMLKTTDYGKSWQRKFITSNSTNDNLRPVSPKGAKPDECGVLWFSGRYTTYKDYETSISGLCF